MGTYKYEFRQGNGSVSSGVLTADSLNQATAMARSQGGFLLNVTPISAGAGFIQKLRTFSVEFGPGLADLLAFTNQLSVMIKAGINIRNAIGTIAEQVETQKFRRILMAIKNDVEGGKTFSEALCRHPKVFPPLYINMIRASELSGNLGHMLQRIAEHLDQQCRTRSMVRGAMVYPAIIATMAVTTTVFMLTFVLPRFTALFEGKEDLLPMPTVVLMDLSAFLRGYYYLVLLGAVGLAVGLKFALRTEIGGLIWDHVKLRMPMFKGMFRSLYISRGMHTMGELVNAGVPMLDTLKITADVSGNRLHEHMWNDVHDAVKQGRKIADPLSKQTLLPPNVLAMVSAGEESGNLGDVLSDVAAYYQRELEAAIKAVTAMIEPLMIVIMGLLVGFIAASIMLPIFKMSSVVG